MDHSEVVRLKAVEKYMLSELSPEVREEFEEHFFDCAECASDIKALDRFRAASRMIFEDEIAAGARQKPRKEWFAWLRPAIAVPAIAALGAAVVFLTTVTIPRLREQATKGTTAEVYESSYRLQGNTRSGNTSPVEVVSNQSFALDFDFIPSASFERYEGRLVDSSGKSVLVFPVQADEANKELHLVVPRGMVRTGRYTLVFLGEGAATKPMTGAPEVQRLSFFVEVRP
jgi:Putative zinc-finger